MLPRRVERFVNWLLGILNCSIVLIISTSQKRNPPSLGQFTKKLNHAYYRCSCIVGALSKDALRSLRRDKRQILRRHSKDTCRTRCSICDRISVECRFHVPKCRREFRSRAEIYTNQLRYNKKSLLKNMNVLVKEEAHRATPSWFSGSFLKSESFESVRNSSRNNQR